MQIVSMILFLSGFGVWIYGLVFANQRDDDDMFFRYLFAGSILLIVSIGIAMKGAVDYYDNISPCDNYGVINMQRSDKALIVCEDGSQHIVDTP